MPIVIILIHCSVIEEEKPSFDGAFRDDVRNCFSIVARQEACRPKLLCQLSTPIRDRLGVGIEYYDQGSLSH